MEFMQNRAFSTGQYRKEETCLDFLLAQIVIYASIISLNQISSWSKYVTSTFWPFEKNTFITI